VRTVRTQGYSRVFKTFLFNIHQDSRLFSLFRRVIPAQDPHVNPYGREETDEKEQKLTEKDRKVNIPVIQL